ncbi:hypothetical protein GJAV_G00229170 [Gymnothorax javanicus]|nr:hypothetical protein GJAV_G00229170 [Gymnothorax javanicus]
MYKDQEHSHRRRPALKTDAQMQIFVDPYETFMLHHLRHYGLFTGFSDQRTRISRAFALDPQFRGFLGTSDSDFTNQGTHVSGAVTGDQTLEQDHDATLSDKNSSSSSDPGSDLQDKENEVRHGSQPFSLPAEQAPRSRQLVFDPDQNFSILRLREPQGLYSSLSLSNPPQGVRWPVECQVIKEEIQHIGWEPPQLEPFYQATGHERAPLPVGEEKGKVVFQIEPATKNSFFTFARVGGSRGSIKNCRSFPSGCGDSILEFESRFESGNLQKAVQTGLHDYELTLRTDLYTSKHTQWFYFRVRNMKAGPTYRFTIINLLKPSSLYSLGMKPLLYSEGAAVSQGIGWQRVGADIKYYANQSEHEGHALYSLTWTCQFPYEGDTCYFAHCYPYTYSNLRCFLTSVSSDPVTAALCKVRVLCRSLAGNSVYVLTITSPSTSREVSQAKRAVVVTARVHPGETVGSWAMQGLLEFLLGDSPDAQLLRDAFVFKVVPMLNPDGVVVGNYRCSLAGRDLNRNYRTLLRDAFPCVWHTRNMVKRVLAEREVVMFCDFHGHSRKNNVFMYGCENRSSAHCRSYERVFPLMLSKNASNKFSYRNCKFKVQKSKEGTGRVVMWKLGIANSYTMESTFAGSTLGDRKRTHFTTQDLKSLGYCFCDTLLDFCDPDPTKVNVCLAELAAMRQEAHLKLDSLGGVSGSDLESSTSGSNSTDSNDLPAHLLNIIDKKAQCKKKRLRTRKERTRLRQERVLNSKAKISPLTVKHNQASMVPGEGASKTENQAVAAGNDIKKEKRDLQLEAVTSTYLHFQGPVDATQPAIADKMDLDSRRAQLRAFSQQPRQQSLHRQLITTASLNGSIPSSPTLPCRSPAVSQLVQCTLFPVFASPLELPTRPPRPSTRPTGRLREGKAELARVSITFGVPEAFSTSTDSVKNVRKSQEKESASGAMLVGDLDCNHGSAESDGISNKQAVDTDPFLPSLRKPDLTADSRSRRLSPLVLAKASEMALGLPKVPAAGPLAPSSYLPQRSRLQRLQSLTLANNPRLPRSSGKENGCRDNSPCSPAPDHSEPRLSQS